MFSVCLDVCMFSSARSAVFEALAHSVGPKGSVESDSECAPSASVLHCTCAEATDASMNTLFKYLPLDEVGDFVMQHKNNVTMLSH